MSVRHIEPSVPTFGATADVVRPHAGPEFAALATITGATFDHFAIATPRIRDLLPLWRDTLGGRFALGADNPEIGWRAIRLQFGEQICVELIEPLAGSEFLDAFLAKNPAGGVHHVTFFADDIKAAFERLEAAGYAPFGADETWFQLFVHPKRANGVLLQLMRRHDFHGADSLPVMTLDEVLAGHGINGTGTPSP